MLISKVLVAMLAVSAMAMAVLQSVEGGRDMAMKEADDHNPQMFSEILGYKSKEDYDCDGYKYKGHGNCDKSPYSDDDDWRPYKKHVSESKEVAGKYGVPEKQC